MAYKYAHVDNWYQIHKEIKTTDHFDETSNNWASSSQASYTEPNKEGINLYFLTLTQISGCLL